MSAVPKLGAFITARNGRIDGDGVSLKRVFRRTKRGLRSLAVYVELGELLTGHRLKVEVRVVDDEDQLIWESIASDELVRYRERELLFQLDGMALKLGSVAVELHVNGILLDVRRLSLE